MRLLADENVPGPSIRVLRAAGFEVESIREIAAGSPDPDVLAHAREHGQILVTFDRDFGELVYRFGALAPAGIVYLRLSPADPEEGGRVLRDLLGRSEIQLLGRFTIVDRDRVRQRPFLKLF
jgi:predicted nuclease of predicted toxin-antitoxin system